MVDYRPERGCQPTLPSPGILTDDQHAIVRILVAETAQVAQQSSIGMLPRVVDIHRALQIRPCAVDARAVRSWRDDDLSTQ